MLSIYYQTWINYDKILKIETNIAVATVTKMEDSGGVYVPSSIQKECPIYFAVDNCDFQNDTPDGKHEKHWLNWRLNVTKSRE